MATANTLAGYLSARGMNSSVPLLQALDAFGMLQNQAVLNFLSARGIPLTRPFKQVQNELGLTGQETLDQAWGKMQALPAPPDSRVRSETPQPVPSLPTSLTSNPAGTGAAGTGLSAIPITGGVGVVPGNVGTSGPVIGLAQSNPASTGAVGASSYPVGGGTSTTAPTPPVSAAMLPVGNAPPGQPVSSNSASNYPAGVSPQAPPPPSLIQLLTKAGMDLSTPIGQALPAFQADPKVAALLQSKGVDLNSPIGDVMKAMGLTGQEPLSAASSKLESMAAISAPPAGQFPQVPPIQLPPGLGPTTFNAPPAPNLPSTVSLPPELQSLMASLKANFDTQQQTRDSLLSNLQAGIAQQQANANANQPLLDAALRNIQSVLTGQAMSPGVEGLVNSAFAPAENEGQIRLRQAAEEAAAARGMHVTDTPIGQPYLDETRRFLEQMGGQRAQAAIGIRNQDATFAEQVRQFQEGLKQQALTNQTDVLRTLGTPEQAAGVLSTLGLGARNAAVQQFGIESQQALGASDQALRAALGQAQTNQGNTQLALASQNQGFQQQLAQQQASIQNQLGLMQALGDPYQAFNLGSTTGNTLSQQRLSNLLNLNSGIIGYTPNFSPTGMTTTTSQPSTIGSQLLGLGGTLGAAYLMGGV